MNTKLSAQIQLMLQYPLSELPISFYKITGMKSADIWDVLLIYNGDIEDIDIEITNLTILSARYATCSVNKNRLEALAQHKVIEYITLPEVMQYISVQSEVCALNLDSPLSGYEVTGRGTYFGSIDTGVDYTHPDFINPDGTSRILYLWDQTIAGNSPEGFNIGTEFTNEDINYALQTGNLLETKDALGHGTALASIAVGNSEQYKGIAPGADLVVVKVGQVGVNLMDPYRGPRNAEIMMALKYVVEKARQDNRPISILIGFGINEGGHNGSSLLEQYIDYLSSIWKVNMVVGTGNQANKDSHTAGEVKQGQTHTIGVFIDSGQPYYFTSIWKNFIDDFGVSVVAPNGERTIMLTRDEVNSNTIIGNSIVSINFSQQGQISNGEQILVFIDTLFGNEIKDGNWKIELTGLFVLDGKYNAWGEALEQVTRSIRFINPVISNTLTIPATSSLVTSVAATNGFQVASFSGRGFQTTNSIKPDISAPGVDITAAYADKMYQKITGTSAAAAFVAGAYLLLFEYGINEGGDNYLYGDALKAYLLRTAKRRFGVTFPSIEWGYGELCVKNTLEALSRLYKLR
ncbi:MAG: hypothetical protein BEN19_02325 [Epulopiscium sp. Nuni2H_MBin003]|nr:MAG: hypothetical protein BEN19_02325 [Epulopiscium sp. Nuni2H_MBin003]